MFMCPSMHAIPAASIGSSADPYYSSVIFLSHLDADNGAGQVVPQKYAGGNIAIQSGASISSTQSVFGGKSLRTTTTNGGLYTSTGAAIGSGDFTIEGWFRFDSVSSITNVMVDLRPSNTTGVYPLIVAANAELRYSVNATTRISAAGVLAANTWYFIAVSRVSGSTRMYLGTSGTASQVGSTYTDANNYLNGDLGIGTSAFAGSHMGGYIDDVRVTSVGRYSGTTCPIPAAPFPNS